MREIERILDQLNRAWGGDSWTGVAIQPMLDDVTEEQARAHPLPEAHSIIELVAHIAAWMDAASDRLAGGQRELGPEEDWRDVTSLSWPAAIESITRAQSRLCDAIARTTTDDLDRMTPGRDYTLYVLIHGVIQHNMYHAGQIALLKKQV